MTLTFRCANVTRWMQAVSALKPTQVRCVSRPAFREDKALVYVAGYISTLIIFGVVDALWLSVMGALFYKPLLGDILLSSVRIGPALAFYAMYPVGVLVFAILPALRSGSANTALALGLLLGAVAYATYDLTNFATLRNWSLQIVIVDIVYGSVATGFAATASYFLTPAMESWLGSSAN